MPLCSFVGTPAEAVAFVSVTLQFDLRADLASGHAWMCGSVPYHDSAIRALCCNDIRVLRLVPSSIHLAWMINFLCDIELHLDLLLLRRAAPIASNLSGSLIVVLDISLPRFRELY